VPVGAINLKVTGTDLGGLSASDEFQLTVAPATAGTRTGTVGSDVLSAGGGSFAMVGGFGDDYYFVDDVGDTVVELANEGRDQIYSSVSFALPANVELISLSGSAIQVLGNDLANQVSGNEAANWLIGRGGNDSLYGYGGNDSLDGGDGDDYVVGGDGDDTLRGGAGTNQLSGGPGNDTYYVDTPGGLNLEGANEGIDTIIAGVNITLSTTFENVTLTGALPLEVQGNGVSNVLVGNSGDNVLFGNAGDDILHGGLGNDIVGGGTGNDTIDGGDGSNWYVFSRGDGQDTLRLATGDPTAGRINTLNMVAIHGYEVALQRVGDNLEIWLGADKITAELFFLNNDPGHSRNPLQEIRFNSETWDLAKIRQMTPNAGALSLSTSSVQRLSASDERRSNHAISRDAGGVVSLFEEGGAELEMPSARFTSAVDPLMEGRVQDLLQAMASFSSPPGSGPFVPLTNYQNSTLPIVVPEWRV
jgi:Ca2+-binding RTX toxin-like protein